MSANSFLWPTIPDVKLDTNTIEGGKRGKFERNSNRKEYFDRICW